MTAPKGGASRGTLHDGFWSNGMNDGWLRPPGPRPIPESGKVTLYAARGVALSCHYYVAWVVSNIHKRSDLCCNFDTLEEARAYIAEHPGEMSGGVYDRRLGRWAD